MSKLSVFQQILKQIPRRQFQSIVEKHGSDKWVKSFSSWQHLVAMLFAQASAQTSLRDVVATFNAHPARHYHLGARPLARSTLADANAARPVAVFEALLNVMLGKLTGRSAGDAKAAVRLLDSTVISLSHKLHRWAAFRSNNTGIKVSMVFDPEAQCPTFFEIAPARMTDQTLARAMPIEPGATYVFDRGYMDAAFWNDLHIAGCRFVTRAKKNYHLDEVKKRIDPTPEIFADDLVRLEGKRFVKFPHLLRRIVFYCEETQKELVFLTNDMDSKAIVIAALYKQRWQIELFFKWIKQNLELKRFLANNPNAVRLQIITALIVFVALRLLQQASRITAPLKRLRAVAKSNLFNLSAIESLLSPKQRKSIKPPSSQLCWNFPGQ
jgi:putative transposase